MVTRKMTKPMLQALVVRKYKNSSVFDDKHDNFKLNVEYNDNQIRYLILKCFKKGKSTIQM